MFWDLSLKIWFFSYALFRHAEFIRYAELVSCLCSCTCFWLTGPFWFSESGIFGRPIGIRSADFGLGCFPGLFSNSFNNDSFWTYCALAHDLIKGFQRDF